MTIGDTIVAPSTPFGHSGLAVVRVSGVGAIQIISKLSSRNNFSNRLATLSTLNDLNGNLIDRCIVTVFYGPNSYTGEDVVEISTHGNPSVVGALVGAVCAHGGRLAHPGEFTRRAFLNGKLDLVQAEAVAALIQRSHVCRKRREPIPHEFYRDELRWASHSRTFHKFRYRESRRDLRLRWSHAWQDHVG